MELDVEAYDDADEELDVASPAQPAYALFDAEYCRQRAQKSVSKIRRLWIDDKERQARLYESSLQQIARSRLLLQQTIRIRFA